MLDSFSQLAFPIQALIATLFTWALTSLGACVVFFMRQPNRNVMDAMLGLAGGVMVRPASALRATVQEPSPLSAPD